MATSTTRRSGFFGPWRHVVILALASGFLLSHHAAVAAEAATQVDQAASLVAPTSARQLLERYGVDESDFRSFADGQAVDADEQNALLSLLYAVRRFSEVDVARWTEPRRELPGIIADSEAARGRIVRLTGLVRRVTVEELPVDLADRFDLRRYYRAEMEIDPDGARAVIFVLEVPRAWRLGQELNERASVSGFYIKRETLAPAPPRLVFAARRIAWRPHDGEFALLGQLGMDVGLFDTVRDRRSITAEERECFYALLAAVGQAGKHELERRAAARLERLTPSWSVELAKLSPPDDLDAAQMMRRAVLERMVARAAEGRFDVYPMFNEPAAQRGRAVVLGGMARRAIRIRVDEPDVVDRFGIDHYFEIEMFTDDSDGNPIVFCVRELPPGMPEGERIHEPVRIAGIFFKSWAYRASTSGERDALVESPTSELRLAPLVVGRAPFWLPPPERAFPLMSWLAGAVFVVLLAGLWLLVWYFRRGDRKFFERAIARRYQAPDGALDELRADDRGADADRAT